MPDLPPREWQFQIHTDRFLLQELRQMKWHIYPPEYGNLRFIQIDSYSMSSGRAGGRSSGRSTPMGNAELRLILIDSYSKSSGRQCGKSKPPREWQFEIHTDRFLLWELRQIHLTTQAEQVADLSPKKWQFQIHTDRFLFWELRQTR